MSQFLLGKGQSITLDEVEYKADGAGVITVPDEYEFRMHKGHGLSLYIPAPDAPPEAPKAKSGKVSKADTLVDPSVDAPPEAPKSEA